MNYMSNLITAASEEDSYRCGTRAPGGHSQSVGERSAGGRRCATKSAENFCP